MIKRLVLLPGMDGTGELFSEFVSRMPEPMNIEALCYPTDASLSYKQLLDVVEAFVPATDNFVLLAESFSTPLAIQYAATNPPNLRGLILCAGFATSPIRGWQRSIALFVAPMAFRLPLPRIAMSHFLVGPDAPDSLHKAVRAAIRSVKRTVLAARLRQILSVDAQIALGKVSVPILYIQAKQDHLVGPFCLDEIAAMNPRVEAARVEGPHLILQRNSQQCADIIMRFFDSLHSADS
jgi:pimeloyl-ACP methyl ester carboxylesterase